MTASNPHELIDTLAIQALKLAGTRPWQRIALIDICDAAQVNLLECAKASVSKAHIVAQLDKRLDYTMLEVCEHNDQSQIVRDRLFEILMARFDGLELNRASWHSILLGEKFDGAARIARHARRARTGAWALEAAGVTASNLGGAGRAFGLAVALRETEQVWLTDTIDLAKTMAKLDQVLRRGEEWLTQVDQFKRFFGIRQEAEPSPEARRGETDPA